MEQFLSHGIQNEASPKSNGSLEVTPPDKNTIMPIEAIKQMYPNQWVAVEKTDVNEASQCVSGRLIGVASEMPKLHAIVGVLDPNRKLNPSFIFTGSRTQA